MESNKVAYKLTITVLDGDNNPINALEQSRELLAPPTTALIEGVGCLVGDRSIDILSISSRSGGLRNYSRTIAEVAELNRAARFSYGPNAATVEVVGFVHQEADLWQKQVWVILPA